MPTYTLARALRMLRDESLSTMAAAVGCEKSTLSTVERHPGAAGRKLRKRIERHFGVPWNCLAFPIRGEVLAASIIRAVAEKVG